MYAQIVKSDFAAKWNILHEMGPKNGPKILPPKNSASSSVSLALHDLQLTQFPRELFEPITEPLSVFR
jgi:protein arginine N-methyltransferase 7